MTDEYEYGLIKATKSKGRSASVCLSSSSSTSERRTVVAAECFDADADACTTSFSVSSPLTTPASSLAAATIAATNSDEMKYFRKCRPACRSQSVRVSGGKSLRRRARPQDSDADADADADDNRNHYATTIWATAAGSDPKLYSRDSGSEKRASFSSWRQSCGQQSNSNASRHSQSQSQSQCRSHKQGKCTDAYLDIPETRHQPINDKIEKGENSYRLRSFSFTAKGLVNRGDSFKRRHGHGRRSSATADKGDVGDSSESGRKEIGGDTAAEEVVAAAAAAARTNTNSASGAPCADSRWNAGAAVTHTYNVTVMGATGVGKTSLISQFMTSECINAYDRDRDEPCHEQTVSILLNGEESELCFHELKHSKVVGQKYATAADAFLVLYSVVDKSTFQYAETELVRLQNCNVLHNKPAILVGNKIDLARSRTVSSQDGKCLACTFRVKHLEISVGINHNVDELLVGILHQIRLKKHRCECKQQTAAATAVAHRWYKNRTIIRASMKARQMFTWMFGREDSKFKNCENLHTL